MPMQPGISMPPGMAPQQGMSSMGNPNQMALSEMVGLMGGPSASGEEKSAMHYLDVAYEMLTAAADEIPQIGPAVEQVKEFAVQIIGAALGMAPDQNIAQPPMGMEGMGGIPGGGAPPLGGLFG